MLPSNSDLRNAERVQAGDEWIMDACMNACRRSQKSERRPWSTLHQPTVASFSAPRADGGCEDEMGWTRSERRVS